jgi:protein-disulfide isomerase
MRVRVLDVALVVLTLCAVTTTTLVARRELLPPRTDARSQAPRPIRVPDWGEYARHGHRMGPAEAPVSIVVFSDFQCPYCGVLMSRLREVRDAHPAEVAVVYRHFPLRNHPHAAPAARASDCAAEQGKFEAFHDALFAGQDSIGAWEWSRFAQAAGVMDLPRFAACAAGTGPLPTLARDTVAAARLRVTATPTLLINDMRFEGAVPTDTLEAYVRRALAGAATAP